MEEKAALFELLSLLREAEAVLHELDTKVLPKEKLKGVRDQIERINARLAALN